jgi:hypothetical protein
MLRACALAAVMVAMPMAGIVASSSVSAATAVEDSAFPVLMNNNGASAVDLREPHQYQVLAFIAVRRGAAVHRGGYAHRGGVVVGARGAAVFVRRPVMVGGVYRPYGAKWLPGRAIAAGAAIGFVAAATATWAGAPPQPGYCWFYTDATRTNGFWDACPP